MEEAYTLRYLCGHFEDEVVTITIDNEIKKDDVDEWMESEVNEKKI